MAYIPVKIDKRFKNLKPRFCTQCGSPIPKHPLSKRLCDKPVCKKLSLALSRFTSGKNNLSYKPKKTLNISPESIKMFQALGIEV